MNIHIVNGPNLNLLGKREPGIYGSQSFEEYFLSFSEAFPEANLTYFQSNIEGELIDEIQRVGYEMDGIILNAGGYTHTSIALSDTIAAISCPVVEVHISNIFAREEYRHISLIAKNCVGSISGFGLQSYFLAIQGLLIRAKLK